MQLAEQAFLDEFARLVTRLCERVADEGSEGKVFRDSAVNNLTEFFARFRDLNVRSNVQLDELVERRSGRSAASVPRTCATARPCASGSRRSCPRSRPRSTRCWSSGRGGGSCARRPSSGEA